MKKILAIIVLALALVGGFAMNAPVYAADNVCDDPAIASDPKLSSVAGCTDTKRADEVVNGVMGVVFGAVGVLAVGVMIFGGIMYVTSTGDAQKAYRARNIILYGLIGLVVSLMAYAIVFFISQAAGAA